MKMRSRVVWRDTIDTEAPVVVHPQAPGQRQPQLACRSVVQHGERLFSNAIVLPCVLVLPHAIGCAWHQPMQMIGRVLPQLGQVVPCALESLELGAEQRANAGSVVLVACEDPEACAAVRRSRGSACRSAPCPAAFPF